MGDVETDVGRRGKMKRSKFEISEVMEKNILLSGLKTNKARGSKINRKLPPSRFIRL